MKKKRWIPIAAVIVLLAVFFLPIPQGVYEDGGTRDYQALTYKLVDWNKITPDGVYDKLRIYFGADRHKSIDELYQLEVEHMERRFLATVLEINESTVLVAPVEGEEELRSSDKLSFSRAGLEDIGAAVGSVVEVSYHGKMMETYPAKIQATGWTLSKTLRHLEYTDPWLNNETAEKFADNLFYDIVITEIYANCFFARTVIPMPYQIKLNGTLSDEWCVGDQVAVTYTNTYYDGETQRVEVDVTSVAASDFVLNPNMDYKPVIYLYPEEELAVTVKLEYDGGLTCTYPAYEDGWRVTAAPDGTLTDANGQTYNYLYWEGKTNAEYDFIKGFCVKGTDTAKFLEDALAKLGLNRREANEFIVYWLPFMQDHPYNLISFQTDRYTESAKLQIEPEPDTLIRVFMAWKPSETAVALEAQELSAPLRRGFTVIEWGGSKSK